MIETQINASTSQTILGTEKPKKILRMVENDRMGGSVPRWEIAKTPEDHIQHNLENAQYENNTFNSGFAYAPGEIRPNEREFGFADLIDMANPLQHIPLVGHAYREITGDEIHPIGQIIGGALYGGILGAATGLTNTIMIEETGDDIAGNALSAFNAPLSPQPAEATVLEPTPIHTEKPLTKAYQSPPQDLPGNLLSFVDLKTLPDLKPREPITEVKLNGLYGLAR